MHRYSLYCFKKAMFLLVVLLGVRSKAKTNANSVRVNVGLSPTQATNTLPFVLPVVYSELVGRQVPQV